MTEVLVAIDGGNSKTDVVLLAPYARVLAAQRRRGGVANTR